MKYIAVTICRNEEKMIASTIKTVLRQNPQPSVYIVVDDNSVDNTPEIIDSFKSKIKTIHLDKRLQGGVAINMAHSFLKGVRKATVIEPKWEYLLKIDADTRIPQNYVKFLIDEFEHDKKLGIVSGKPIGRKKWVESPSDGSRIYRRNCWEDIDGIQPIIAFDTHALYKAKIKGWGVKVFPINFLEIRKPKIKQAINFKYWFQRGISRKILGFTFLHTLFASIKRIFRRPILIGSIIMFMTFCIYNFSKYSVILDKKYYKKMTKLSKKEFELRIKEFLKSSSTLHF